MERSLNSLYTAQFPELSPLQHQQLSQLKSLYEKWNALINVVSRKDMDDFDERHVLHSLAIYALGQIPADAQVLDVGTGGGFPGIPLAIANPSARFLLIDGRGKKIQVVQAIIDALGLQNLRAEAVRSEQLEGKFDVITARAVTQLPPLVQQIRHLALPSGKTQLLALKGGDLTEELRSYPNAQVWNLTNLFDGPFFETKKLLRLPIKPAKVKKG